MMAAPSRPDRSLDAALTDEQQCRMIRYRLACQLLNPPDQETLKMADRLIFLRWLVQKSGKLPAGQS